MISWRTFPLAFAVVLPAVYPLVILMLMALIIRGTAFEFRFRAPTERLRSFWDKAFMVGSVVASFSQGAILGGLMHGTAVVDRAYAGGVLSWLQPFTVFCGISVVIGYSLLGATWIIWRTSGRLQSDMRNHSKWLGTAMLIVFGVVGLWSPLQNHAFFVRWFNWPGIIATAVAQVVVVILSWFFFTHLKRGETLRYDKIPFLCTLGFFVVSFGGLGYSIFPLIVPPSIDIWQAAAPTASLRFLIFGVLVMIPIIIAYNLFAYYIFRGKVEPGAHYH